MKKKVKYIGIVSILLLVIILAVSIGAFRVIYIAPPSEEPLMAECPWCKEYCEYTVSYEKWTKAQHCVRYWCSNCEKDMLGGCAAEKHDLTLDDCWKCGWPDREPMWVLNLGGE